MKPLTYVALAALLVLKIILVSFYLFRVELSPAFWSTNAVAAEHKTAAQADTNRPVTVQEDKTINDTMLVQKKTELKAQEEELKAIRDEINIKIEKLTQLRVEIKNDLARKETIDGQRFKHLIKVYSGMKPQSAAEIIGKLDKNFAVELLSQMKGETAGAILSFLDREKAARIVEGLAEK
jgi:flagellar motility protein MotE (MotC chaperone)